jgi:hypothetical protein
MRTDHDGGGTAGVGGSQSLLPSPALASSAAAEWANANSSLTFSIRENLDLYRECRANGDWNQCVSHLEGAASAALKLGGVVLKQKIVEAEKPTTGEPVDIELVAQVLDALVPAPPPSPAKPPDELVERAAAIIVETTSNPSTEWWKNHKDYTE